MAMNMNMTVLVVDDSATMRNMFRKMLTSIGFQNIVTAVDGDDAITKIKGQQIDLVISDWNMPNKDGLDLLKWIRSQEATKEMLFIMATAQGDKTQEMMVKKEGGNNHIAKPFTEEMIREVIEETLGVRPAAKAEVRRPKVVAGKVQMKIAHIQITDHLALGVLRHRIEKGEVTPKYFELEPVCMPGWNPVQKELENGNVDGAFILAPIAMDLFGFDVPIRMILLAHKNGSIFVRNKKTYKTDLYRSLDSFYRYKVVDIPHKMSIHNMLAHKYLTDMGLKPGVPGKIPINVRFEVVPPIQMPGIMKENDNIGGFIVAEPIGSKAIAAGIADLEFLSSSLWKDHPCCIVAMRQDFIGKHADAVHEFTEMLWEAGQYISKNTADAAKIAVAFLDPKGALGLSTEVLQKVLSMEGGITMDDMFPMLEDIDAIQRYMHEKMHIGVKVDVEKFVDLQFAEAARKG